MIFHKSVDCSGLSSLSAQFVAVYRNYRIFGYEEQNLSQTFKNYTMNRLEFLKSSLINIRLYSTHKLAENRIFALKFMNKHAMLLVLLCKIWVTDGSAIERSCKLYDAI